MAQIAEPFFKLAKMRIEPQTQHKHDTPGGYGVAPYVQTLSIIEVATSRETAIPLPPSSCVNGFS